MFLLMLLKLNLYLGWFVVVLLNLKLYLGAKWKGDVNNMLEGGAL